MNHPSQSEALAEIFREEALEHRLRGRIDQGEPLRLSAVRLQGSLWVLVGLLAVALVAAGRLRVDEQVSGPAVVRMASAGPSDTAARRADGAPAVGGGGPASCVVVASLPASRVASIHAGSKGRFTEEPKVTAGPHSRPAGLSATNDARQASSPSSLPLVLERVDAPSVSAATVLSRDRGASQSGAMVTVVARLERRAGNVEDGPTGCPEGARGRLEVDLPPRRLLSLLLPDSLR